MTIVEILLVFFCVCNMVGLLYIALSLGETTRNLNTLQKNAKRKFDLSEKIDTKITDWMDKMAEAHTKLEDQVKGNNDYWARYLKIAIESINGLKDKNKDLESWRTAIEDSIITWSKKTSELEDVANGRV